MSVCLSGGFVGIGATAVRHRRAQRRARVRRTCCPHLLSSPCLPPACNRRSAAFRARRATACGAPPSRWTRSMHPSRRSARAPTASSAPPRTPRRARKCAALGSLVLSVVARGRSACMHARQLQEVGAPNAGVGGGGRGSSASMHACRTCTLRRSCWYECPPCICSTPCSAAPVRPAPRRWPSRRSQTRLRTWWMRGAHCGR